MSGSNQSLERKAPNWTWETSVHATMLGVVFGQGAGTLRRRARLDEEDRLRDLEREVELLQGSVAEVERQRIAAEDSRDEMRGVLEHVRDLVEVLDAGARPAVDDLRWRLRESGVYVPPVGGAA